MNCVTIEVIGRHDYSNVINTTSLNMLWKVKSKWRRFIEIHTVKFFMIIPCK